MEKKEKEPPTSPPEEKPNKNTTTTDPNILVIQVPPTRFKRIMMLNAEIGSLQARMHEHLAIICEDNEVDVTGGAVFSPDYQSVIVTKIPKDPPPNLDPS